MLVLKLIAAITLVFVTACQSSPEKTQAGTEPVKADISDTQISPEPKAEKEPESSIDPQVLYLILTAETALQRQQYEVALEGYLEAAKRVDDVRVIEKAARIALFLEDLPKAEQAVLLWLKKDSKNVMARRIALSAALSKKDQAGVIEHLEAILNDYPADFGDTLMDIQKALKTDEDVLFTATLLEDLEKKYPQSGDVFLAQSIMAIREKDYDKAMQKVAKALALQPGWEKALELEAELFLYSGKLAFQNKNYIEALNWFDKVKHESLQFDASMASVSVLFEQKRFNDASNRLNSLLKQMPEQRMRILIMQAELQNQQQNHKKAFAILTQALAEWPDEREILYARSLTAEKMNDIDTVETDLRKILEINPDDAGALNALGYTLVDKTTRYDEAETYLEQALALQPDEAVIIDSYGWLKFKQGDLQAALTYLQQAYEKLPTENEIVAHLAEVLWLLDRKKEAKDMIDKAMSLAPDDKYLLKFKTRFLDKE